jgi:hypothetical protein
MLLWTAAAAAAAVVHKQAQVSARLPGNRRRRIQGDTGVAQAAVLQLLNPVVDFKMAM